MGVCGKGTGACGKRGRFRLAVELMSRADWRTGDWGRAGVCPAGKRIMRNRPSFGPPAPPEEAGPTTAVTPAKELGCNGVKLLGVLTGGG